MTEYEVKCSQTWAWYTGSVHDYNEQEKKLCIKYPDDWKDGEWLDVSFVRYKYNNNDSTWRPTFNEDVECKARAEEREPYGWWPCKAKKYEGTEKNENKDGTDKENELYSVAFVGWGDQHNEILGIEYIRKKSSSLLLSHIKNLYKQTYSVPPELKEWVLTHCSAGTILETLMPHKNISSQIIHITYLEKTNKLLLIGVKRVLITMKDIIFCFFEKQKSLLKLEDRTKKLEEESKRKKEEESKAEKHTFNIHPLLSGYLRGRGGINIDRVKRMCIESSTNQSKIIRIEPQTETCYIAAKDKHSLNFAIDQLQIVCKKVIIPKDEMGQIIGSQGKQIQDIKRKSQVIKVISWFKWPYEFKTLKDNQTHRYGMNEQGDDIPDSIKNATLDNVFDDDDIVDLSNNIISSSSSSSSSSTEDNSSDDKDKDKDKETEQKQKENEKDLLDALVIIGRKSRVELCIFMIEMTLNHFRQITKTRNNVRKLRDKINEIKGNPIPPNRQYRRSYQRQHERQHEQKDRDQNSPQQRTKYQPHYKRYEKYQPTNKRYQQRYNKYDNKQYYNKYDKQYDNKPYDKHYDNKQYDNKYDNKYQNGSDTYNKKTQNRQNTQQSDDKNVTKKRKRRGRKGKNTSANDANKNNE